MNSAPIQIVPATLQHLDTLVQFNMNLAAESEKMTLRKDVVESGVRRALETPELARYFVAECQGCIAGQLMVTFELTDWFDGINWWIQSVYVHKDFRGKGVFRALYDYVVELARHEGDVPRIRLYVEKENAAAISAYEKCGMEQMPFHLYHLKLLKRDA